MSEERVFKFVNGEQIELTREEIEAFKREIKEANETNFPIEKQNRIKQLKTNCSNYIYSKYPIYKQLNIANNIIEGKEQMTFFIQATKSKCNEIETQLEQTTNRTELLAINIEFVERTGNEQNGVLNEQ